MTLSGLEAGRYHLYVYGHADSDVTGEQNSVVTIRSGTNVLGPQALNGSAGGKQPCPGWRRPVRRISRSTRGRGHPCRHRSRARTQRHRGAKRPANYFPRHESAEIVADGRGAWNLHQTNLIIREVEYDGQVSDNEARFKVSLEIESLTTNEISAPLFEGDVALMVPKLPSRCASLVRRGNIGSM